MIEIIPHNYDPVNNYYDAMNSEKWQITRKEVIKRDGCKCRFCGSTACLQVHHIRYQNCYGQTDYYDKSNLITLCAPCHEIVSEAVKAAKDTHLEVPAFLIRPGQDPDDQLVNSVKHSAYLAEANLVADTLFKIWKRTINSDCKVIKMRSLAVMKPIGEVIISTIESQAGTTPMGHGVAFVERTIKRITGYLAKAYNHYASRGMRDDEFMRWFDLKYDQLVKVKKNAERVLKDPNFFGDDPDG